MSYARYRNLCMGKSKKVTKSFLEMFMSSLQDPGPDIVVCDEGHVLKVFFDIFFQLQVILVLVKSIRAFTYPPVTVVALQSTLL